MSEILHQSACDEGMKSVTTTGRGCYVSEWAQKPSGKFSQRSALKAHRWTYRISIAKWLSLVAVFHKHQHKQWPGIIRELMLLDESVFSIEVFQARRYRLTLYRLRNSINFEVPATTCYRALFHKR